MQRAQDFIRRGRFLTWTVGLLMILLALGVSGPAQGAEDLFVSMAVQRPASPGPAPDLALPNVEGETVRLSDFRGKVVLLGFFATT